MVDNIEKKKQLAWVLWVKELRREKKVLMRELNEAWLMVPPPFS